MNIIKSKIMKKFSAYFLYTLLLAAVVCACSDNLDILQSYGFDLQTLPVQKRIVQGESAEIRCEIVREGNYTEESYQLRYFQTDGIGELRLDNGTLLAPNDLYPLDRLAFRLYYTSRCTDQQNIDVYVVNRAGLVVRKTFSWQNDSGSNDSEEN